MKVITLKELRADRIQYMEVIIERNQQLVQLQQQVSQLQVSIMNLEGALAHVNQNIKIIEDAEAQRKEDG